jgi:hypothetical protein
VNLNQLPRCEFCDSVLKRNNVDLNVIECIGCLQLFFKLEEATNA